MDSTVNYSDHSILDAIVTRMADHLGVDTFDLEPLATAVEPEMLSAFATSDAVSADSEIRFRYHGCTVRLTGAGEVFVEETA